MISGSLTSGDTSGIGRSVLGWKEPVAASNFANFFGVRSALYAANILGVLCNILEKAGSISPHSMGSSSSSGWEARAVGTVEDATRLRFCLKNTWYKGSEICSLIPAVVTKIFPSANFSIALQSRPHGHPMEELRSAQFRAPLAPQLVGSHQKL